MLETYIINSTDTIEDIAKKYNTTKEVIEYLNSNTIFSPGTNILVPSISNEVFTYYIIRKGDTLSKIASDNQIDLNLLAKLNGLNPADYIYENTILLVPKAGSILYITSEGDTLSKIANDMNIDITNLIDENKYLYLQPEQLIVHKYK